MLVVQDFIGCRRDWLAAVDLVGRGEADVTLAAADTTKRRASQSSAGGGNTAVATNPGRGISAVMVALADTQRVSVVGDLCTRPRVCASVYGGMVAMFLPCTTGTVHQPRSVLERFFPIHTRAFFPIHTGTRR